MPRVPRGVGEERWTCNPRVSGSIPVARLYRVLFLDLMKALIMGVIVGGDEIMICCFGKQSLPIESASMTLVVK